MKESQEKIKKPKKVKLSKEEKKKIKQERKQKFASIKGISQLYATYIFETIYIFLIEILFKYGLGSFSFNYSLLRIFISSLIFSFVITLITSNLNQKIRKIILILFNFIIVFYAWLQLGFVDYLGTFMSIGNAEQGTKITDFIIDFLCAYDINTHILYLPFIISIFYYIYERYIICDGYNKKLNFKNLLHNIILCVYFIILNLCYYVTLEVDFMQSKYQTVSNKELFIYPSSPSTTIKNFGTSVYFLLDLKSTIFGGPENVYAAKNNKEKEESETRKIDDTLWKTLIETEDNKTLNVLNNYFINRNIAEVNEYTGIFKDKNVIFIMLESISQAVFSEEYKEYFPTLYKLYTEGITGVNNYSPRNNCATGDSEMTSQISLYSIETTCTVNSYKNNKYPQAIMSMLRKNGYYTTAYHNYSDQYYERNTIEYNFGSSVYYGAKALKIDYSSIYKEWPSDIEFMEKALPKFIDEEKFASYMITVSAHTPYAYSSETGNKYISLFKDLDLSTPVKRYLSKVKYADLALEYLIEELINKNILEDTVLVLFGDHYPYGLSDKQYQSLVNYDINVNQEIDRTPFIIYNSETEAKQITKITSPLDYTPTLLNLLGIEYDPRHYMGNDIFSEYRDFALFANNSWQSSYGFYDATKDEFIPNEEIEKKLSVEEIIAINNEVSELRNMSALAIKKDYFNYLYSYFEEAKSKTEEDNKKKSETEE